MFNGNRLLIHYMAYLHNTFELKVLWNLLEFFSLLHFQTCHWLKRDKFSLTYVTLFSKLSFVLSIFFSSCFLSKIRLQNFLSANLVIVKILIWAYSFNINNNTRSFIFSKLFLLIKINTFLLENLWELINMW